MFPAGIETCKQALAKAELLESRLPDLLAILSIHFYCTLPERAGIVGVLFDAEVMLSAPKCDISRSLILK